MNDIDKSKVEKLTLIVRRTVEDLSGLFKIHGMDGIKEIVDPSLDELYLIINSMKDIAEAAEKELMKHDNDTVNYAEAGMLFQNLKQGLLYAESLIVAIKISSEEACKKAIDDMDKNNIPDPNWSK